MNIFKNKIWLYWFVTDLLLIADVGGWFYGLEVALVLTILQVFHFGFEQKSFLGFAVQVRIAYALLLLIAVWPPFYWLLYPVILGTTAMVLFDYCFLARFMSLMPWNHNQKYSFKMVFQTFISKPINGSVQKN